MRSQFLKKTLSLSALLAFIFLYPVLLLAENEETLESNGVRVVYAPQLKQAAKEVSLIYPGIKKDIETIFTWKINEMPTVFLIPDRETFLKMITDS